MTLIQSSRTSFSAVVATFISAIFYLGCSTSSLTTNPTPVKCQVSAPGGGGSIAASGGSATLAITAQPECAWTASADTNWISELRPNAGQGNASIEVVAAANPSGTARQANIKVNDAVVAVTQDAAPCQFTVTGPSDVAAGGGPLSFGVATLSGCSWTSTSTASWLTPGSSSGGIGPGTVTFTAAANGGGARNGSITVAGRTITVNQPAGNDCLNVSPLSALVAAAGGQTPITVSANGPCAWSASSPVPWITVSPDSGQGGGTVTATIAANTGAARSATLTVAGQSVTVSQSSLICSYAVTPGNYPAPAMSSASGFSVATNASCTWSATTTVPWIVITGGASGNGSGAVTFTVAANTAAARSGTIHAADQTFSVDQAAPSAPTPPPPPPPSCSYTLGATSQTVASGAGSGSAIAVTTTSGCGWTATSNAPWITITSAANSTGSSAVAFTVTANTGSTRSGTLTIAGQTYTVTQSAPAAPPPPACSYSINPTSQSIVSGGGGGGPIAVTTTGNCAWTAASNDTWLTIASGGSGNGNGTVTFTAASNTGSARAGTLTIAGQTYTVNQAAAPPPCSFSINPSSATVAFAGGAGPAIQVTAGSGCGWTSGSNASWLTLNSGASGTGNGTVTFTAAANTGSARVGTLTIAGQTFTVTQPALLCSFSLNPTSLSTNKNARTGRTFTVTTTAGCPWTAVSHASWLTITGPTLGTGLGSGTVTFSIAANEDQDDRTGRITVADQTFTVVQGGH